MRVNGMRSVSSFSAVYSAVFRKPLGTVVTRLNDRNRIATLIEKLAHCLWFFEKPESSAHKRRGLRNFEKGMEFLTYDGWGDEYNK